MRSRWVGFVVFFGGWALTFSTLANEKCLNCHGKMISKRLPDGSEKSLYVNPTDFSNSVHGELNCVACHTDITSVPHEGSFGPVQCGVCHENEVAEYRQSIHGRGSADAPTCVTCHGTHDAKAPDDPESSVSRKNITELCLRCHTDEKITARHALPKPATIKLYERSVHGKRLLQEGVTAVAECIDCHGTHNIEPADDPRSVAYKPKIPALCGRCHADILATYRRSVHSQAVTAGVMDAPVCTDCHGEHTIAAPTEPESKVAPTNIAKTCSECHESVALAEKYGLAAHRYSTYMNSYHGVANRYGRAMVANCASCHGVHDILPSSDPASSIHPTHLPETCGKCHPGAGVNILKGGKIHVEASVETSPGTYYVRKFYTWFIAVLSAGFVLYIGIETYGRFRRKRQG